MSCSASRLPDKQEGLRDNCRQDTPDLSQSSPLLPLLRFLCCFPSPGFAASNTMHLQRMFGLFFQHPNLDMAPVKKIGQRVLNSTGQVELFDQSAAAGPCCQGRVVKAAYYQTRFLWLTFALPPDGIIHDQYRQASQVLWTIDVRLMGAGPDISYLTKLFSFRLARAFSCQESCNSCREAVPYTCDPTCMRTPTPARI